jgi:hypothetical protein
MVSDTLVLGVLIGNGLVSVGLVVQYLQGRRSGHQTALLLGSALVWVGFGTFQVADDVAADHELVVVASAAVVSLSGMGWLGRWWTGSDTGSDGSG